MSQWNRAEILSGLKGGAVIAVSSAPLALLFGAIAIDNGMSAFEVGLMSATVYAGASQLVGIELFGNHVAPWLVILSVFAVNFRHVLYSAAMAPFIRHFSKSQKALAFFLLIDPQFAETLRRGERGTPVTFTWYLAFAGMVYIPWVTFSLVGAWLGSRIGDPTVWAIDVLLPIYFMGLVVGFRHRPGFYPVVLASALASVAAFLTIGSPWHVSVGALAGIVVAALLPLPATPATESKP